MVSPAFDPFNPLNLMYSTPGRNIIGAGQSGQMLNSAASMFGNPVGAGVASAGPFAAPALASTMGPAAAQYAQGSLFNQALPAAASTGAAAAPLASAAGGAATGLGDMAPALAFVPDLSRASLAGAAPYAAAGIGLGALYNHFNLGGSGSNLNRGGTGAITGAGIGAGVGSLFGPGPGTAIGAGLGFLAGGALGIFHHGPSAEQQLAKSKSTVDKAYAAKYSLLDAALPASMDNTTRQGILSQLTDHAQMLQSLGLTDKGGTIHTANGQSETIPGIQDVSNSLIASIPTLIKQQRDTQYSQQQSAAAQIALQGFISQQMAPYLQNFTDTAERSAAEYEKLGRNDLAAQARSSAARTAAAYATQAAGLPAYQSMQSQLDYAHQVLNIQQQQQLSALYGKSSTTPTSLTSIASQ